MEDPRCCGTGTCIINADGYCWCGQRWDGEKMCFPTDESASRTEDGHSADPDAPSASD
jgi:hypothetical protein